MTKRVDLLCVEDDLLFAGVLLRVLREFSPVVVGTVQSALCTIVDNVNSGHPVKCLVCDLKMPGFEPSDGEYGGARLIELVQQESPSTRIVVLSGATASYVRPWGSIPVLAKPVEPHVLKREVRIALRVDSGQLPVIPATEAHLRFDDTLAALEAHSAKLRGER